MRIMQYPCRIIIGLTLSCVAAFAQGCQKAASPAPAQTAPATETNALDASVKGQAVPETTVRGERADWGQVIDPDQDCKLTPGPRSLTVDIPASWHDLAGPPLLKFNAPRVLREVTGDFVLTVKVSGNFKPRPPSTSSPWSVPYLGGGILLWGDSDNFIRLERATLLRDGQVVPHIAFLKQEGGDGKPVDYVIPFEERLLSATGAQGGSDSRCRLRRRGRLETAQPHRHQQPEQVEWADGARCHAGLYPHRHCLVEQTEGGLAGHQYQ